MRRLKQQDLLSDIPLKAKVSARQKAAAKEFVVEDIAYSLGRGIAVQSDLIKRNGSDCAVVIRREHKSYYVELDGQQLERAVAPTWSDGERIRRSASLAFLSRPRFTDRVEQLIQGVDDGCDQECFFHIALTWLLVNRGNLVD